MDASLHGELWRHVESSLARGAPLSTPARLLAALEAAYRSVVGRAPEPQERRWLGELVRRVNAERPETYLARGVQNAVLTTFAHGVERLRWDRGRVERYGTASIQRFLRTGPVRGFLVDIGLPARLIDVQACVRHGAEVAGALGRERESRRGQRLRDLTRPRSCC